MKKDIKKKTCNDCIYFEGGYCTHSKYQSVFIYGFNLIDYSEARREPDDVACIDFKGATLW